MTKEKSDVDQMIDIPKKTQDDESGHMSTLVKKEIRQASYLMTGPRSQPVSPRIFGGIGRAGALRVSMPEAAGRFTRWEPLRRHRFLNHHPNPRFRELR